MVPAFKQSWVNFFFFGVYLYVGVFFLMAILLAIIVESYWEYSKMHVKVERKLVYKITYSLKPGKNIIKDNL